MMRSTWQTVSFLQLLILTGCASALTRLKSDKLEDQLVGLASIERTDSAELRQQAISTLLILANENHQETGTRAWALLTSPTFADGRTGLDIAMHDEATCGAAVHTVRRRTTETPLPSGPIGGLVGERLCPEATEWLWEVANGKKGAAGQAAWQSLGAGAHDADLSARIYAERKAPIERRVAAFTSMEADPITEANRKAMLAVLEQYPEGKAELDLRMRTIRRLARSPGPDGYAVLSRIAGFTDRSRPDQAVAIQSLGGSGSAEARQVLADVVANRWVSPESKLAAMAFLTSLPPDVADAMVQSLCTAEPSAEPFTDRLCPAGISLLLEAEHPKAAERLLKYWIDRLRGAPSLRALLADEPNIPDPVWRALPGDLLLYVVAARELALADASISADCGANVAREHAAVERVSEQTAEFERRVATIKTMGLEAATQMWVRAGRLPELDIQQSKAEAAKASLLAAGCAHKIAAAQRGHLVEAAKALAGVGDASLRDRFLSRLEPGIQSDFYLSVPFAKELSHARVADAGEPPARPVRSYVTVRGAVLGAGRVPWTHALSAEVATDAAGWLYRERRRREAFVIRAPSTVEVDLTGREWELNFMLPDDVVRVPFASADEVERELVRLLDAEMEDGDPPIIVTLGERAAATGFQVGDQVLGVGVLAPRTALEIARILRDYQNGERAVVQVRRGGGPTTVAFTVTMGDAPGP